MQLIAGKDKGTIEKNSPRCRGESGTGLDLVSRCKILRSSDGSWKECRLVTVPIFTQVISFLRILKQITTNLVA